MNTIGYIHVAKLNHWKDVFRDQTRKLRDFGLYDKTSKIYVTVVGGGDEGDLLSDPKFEVHRHDDIGVFEFPALERIYSHSALADFKLWYIHSKGVSRPGEYDNMEDWRQFMEYFVLEKHGLCTDALDSFDICGVNWRTRQKHHFSGNFWWARSDYIRSLTPPSSLDQTDRYQAEWWIGGNPDARVSCLFDSRTRHYYERYPRQAYASPD